ncbi:MAG: lysylphosphatidylglycerol synthase transmembrane domain-containing protein [candidate division KSB1 bacterium]|nr:lysylphosphatidylglycerol synthase transmembrane domain-containing protein [candidate division KSB1 bacterium]
MKRYLSNWKLWLGIAFSAFFLFLSFRKVDFARMGDAFQQMHFWMIIPAVALMFFSHWLRALRWKFLVAPLSQVNLKVLYSSLLIGYMANTFLPAHLGEFIRAYMVGKKHHVHGGSVFATIVVERIIDMFTLLILMALTLIVFPFPDWVKQSGIIAFLGILLLFLFLVFAKFYRDRSLKLVKYLLTPFPDTFGDKIIELLNSFVDGLVALKNWKHYLAVIVLSPLIWLCYMLIFQIGLQAFEFVSQYNLPWTTALVLQVITTIAIVVPSSPGYVGTYHFLCQISLAFFAVPKSEGLTFAIVLHAINFFPVLVVGLVMIFLQGLNIRRLQENAKQGDAGV